MSAKIVYFILSEHEIHLAYSIDESFYWLEKSIFSNKTDFYYKEQLQSLIEKHASTISDANEHIVMWYSPVSSLVPMNLLETMTPKELLQHSYSTSKIQFDTDYNRISELSIVNIYDIPLWVKSFFVLRFPRVVIQHLGTGLIRGMFNGSSFKPTLHIFLTTEYALMIMVKHNELLFYNSFEYSNENDLVYYALNILTQTNSLSDNGNCILHPFSEATIDVDVFLNKWKSIREVETFTGNVSKEQTLKFLATCV